MQGLEKKGMLRTVQSFSIAPRCCSTSYVRIRAYTVALYGSRVCHRICLPHDHRTCVHLCGVQKSGTIFKAARCKARAATKLRVKNWEFGLSRPIHTYVIKHSIAGRGHFEAGYFGLSICRLEWLHHCTYLTARSNVLYSKPENPSK